MLRDSEKHLHNQFENEKGERVDYDVCSESDLETAKAFYDNYEYIGSSYRTFHNGVENNWPKEHHFFIRKNQTP